MNGGALDFGGRLAELVERGGPVVAILLALSVLALAIALVKLQQFARARIWSRSWLGAVLDSIRAGESERALVRLHGVRGPLARVLEHAVRCRTHGRFDENGLREEIERVGQAEIASLESHLRGLDTIASLAPLLGLLGTVMGMIRAFAELEQAGSRADAALLAGGIWEALLTTAVGLAVAIPTLAVLAGLESQVDRFRRRLSDAVTQVLSAPALGARERGQPHAREQVSGSPRGTGRAL